MKISYIAILLFLGITTNLNAQDASVEKSLFGIQTGIIGIWVHNETRLADEFVLRTEVGFDAGFFGGGWHNDFGFLLAPVISAEPRWYYNFKKRTNENRKTVNNSANFLALKVRFHPDWFVISNADKAYVYNQIAVIPKWAIKRTIGQHFVYEVGAGIGYHYILDANYMGNGDWVGDLHIRLGYNF